MSIQGEGESGVDFCGSSPKGSYGSTSEETPLLRHGSRSENYRSFDEALDGVGVGVFHLVLVLVCGWAIASDSVEIQCISFVTPQLDSSNNKANQSQGYELKLTKTEEGVLDAIIFVGMMVGGYVWGALSDLIGRRSCLITSLTVNGIFGAASAFSPNYPLFLVFRFFSGVGVGGSFPVVFSYFSEFFSRKSRGPFVIILAAFWILGSIFAALLAWIVIGQFNDSIHSHLGAMTIQAWRVYVILCTFPCLSSALCLVFLPESPAFLFSKGKFKRAAKALRGIQLVNSCCRRSRKGVNSVEEWRSELKEMKSEIDSESVTERRGVWSHVAELFRSTREIFSPTHLRATTVLLIIWFMYSFGYYGLLLWFPEYFKYIEKCNYQQNHNCSINPSHPDHCSHSPIECNMTTDEGGDKIYLDSLYVALAGLPGTLLGILTVNIVGAKAMLTFSLILSGLSSLLIWVIPDHQKTEGVIVILSSVFGGVSIIGWNALDVVSTSELFPVHLRSTAFGVQSVLGRIGAVIGNISFGQLFAIQATPYLPILIVASVLIFAGVAAIFLPTPRGDKTGCHRLRFICLFCCRQCRTKCGQNINYNE